jgi:CheY-like chemotaxis protein
MPEGGTLTFETANIVVDAVMGGPDSELRPGSYVMMAVSDTGTGMAPEVMAQAVQPFFTTKEVGKGSGLGLSMVYGFVKQSGGHFEIDSAVGLGTSIKLYLPRYVGATAPETPSASRPPVGGTETILVVEDDALVRGFVVEQLRSLGYDIIEAHDGAAALALLAAGAKFELLFTDVMLPGNILGPQILDEMRRQQPNLRALFTSGYSEEHVLPRERGPNAVKLLQKPYSLQHLAAEIRAALDAKAASA